MLNWALTFLVVAIVAAFFGFGGIAGQAMDFAKILFVVPIYFQFSLRCGLASPR